jgi:hypothetical protein
MSVQITAYRNIYTTVHLYVKNTVLREWTGTETDSLLTYDPDYGLYMPDYTAFDPDPNEMGYPKPNERGRGWTYFDYPDLESEQTSLVTVRRQNGAALTQNVDYTINYAYGGIEMLNNKIPYDVDYIYNYVAVVDEWRQAIAPYLPVVVVDMSTLSKEGFQLGAGERWVQRGYSHIFASTRAERDDLLDILFSGFYNKQLSPQDFSEGTPLSFDGTFNTGYNIVTLSGVVGPCASAFLDVTSKVLQFNMVNDINEFRASVQFDLHTYMY